MFWQHNGIAERYPRFEMVVESPYTRGAVSGVGVVTMLAGLGELGALFVSRWRDNEAPGPADDTPSA